MHSILQLPGLVILLDTQKSKLTTRLPPAGGSVLIPAHCQEKESRWLAPEMKHNQTTTTTERATRVLLISRVNEMESFT